MNVICTRPTSKLIKGAQYKAILINNLNSKGYSFFRPTIRIYLNDNSIQTFPLNIFKPIDADEFQNSNWICPEYQILTQEREQTKIDSTLKNGDYVVPLYDSLKTLVKGRKYKVIDVNVIRHTTSSWTDIKIKLEGSNRFYSGYNFRKCTHQESREIGLSQIFEETVNTERVNKFKRKFDYYTDEEKTKMLLQFVVESAHDKFRHQFDIIDWAVNKTAKKYKLVREDFTPILNMTIIEIIDYLK